MDTDKDFIDWNMDFKVNSVAAKIITGVIVVVVLAIPTTLVALAVHWLFVRFW